MTLDTITAITAEGRRSSRRLTVLSGIIGRPLTMVCAAYLLLVIVGSLLAPALFPAGPEAVDYNAVLQGPTFSHPLGTDSLGRDVLTRLVYSGGQLVASVLIAIIVAGILAIPAGVYFGLVRGSGDFLASRAADIVLSIPGIIILLMTLALFNQSMVIAMIALGVLGAPGLFRVVRSSSIAVGKEPYIEAARVSGMTWNQIAGRQVLPRVAGPIIVNIALLASTALLTQVGLNFLGLGFQPPAPTWGSVVADGASAMATQPSLLIVSGLVVTITVVAIVSLGDGLRDAVTERWSGATRAGGGRKRRGAPGDDLESNARHGHIERSEEVAAPIVEVTGLTVAYQSEDGRLHPVVRSLSMRVGRAESLGVVGESGSGKTTTGLAILDLLPQGARQTAGTVSIDGVDRKTLTARQRAALRGSKIAFVSQEPMVGLDPLYTVGNQLSQAVRLHRRVPRSEARRIAVKLLEDVHINDPAKVYRSYLHEISGGMAQRVAIAIALAGDPEMIIADEPTTALDVTVQREIVLLLRELQRSRGMAILAISHDWGVISGLCDRALVMYDGECVESGAVKTLINEPEHPYTKALLASNPSLAEPGSRLPTVDWRPE